MIRVLIVDDKPENLYLLKSLLQGQEYEVDEAGHGAEALVRARLQPPDLIIADILMPVMDGYTLLRHWKADERLKNIPFVVYTATYTEPKDERLALDLGADAFILKPTEPEPLLARIKALLEQAQRKELPPVRMPKADVENVLKDYGDILIRKLEEKTLQLQQTNQALHEDLKRRQQAEAEANRLRAEAERARGALLNILEDQRQTEAELRASEERFRRAIVAAPFPIMLHAEDGTILQVSRSWCEITGYTPEELTTTAQWSEHAYGERQGERQADLNRLYALEHQVAEGDRVIRIKGGGTRIWEFSSAPLGPAPDGRRLVVSMALDVTERRRAEAEVRQLNAELEQRVRDRTAQLEVSNKELEAFSYSVSHDLRAPLRGIDGWSQALLEEYGDRLDEPGRKYLGRVRAETQRMGQLIDDLLKLARVTRAAMKWSMVDLSALAQAIVQRIQEAQPDRQIEFVIPPGLTAPGDATLLEVVLTNLLENAAKFTGRRPQARIELGCTPASSPRSAAHPSATPPCAADGATGPVFFVRDNGAGFDLAYAEKLFGAFQRMHKTSDFPGTGIGLATVQRIIHRHGGRIWAEAQIEHGATFFFTLAEIS